MTQTEQMPDPDSRGLCLLHFLALQNPVGIGRARLRVGGVHQQLPNLPAPRHDSQGDVGRALALHQAQCGPPSSPEWVACLSRSHGGRRQAQLLSWPGVAGTPGKFQVACASNITEHLLCARHGAGLGICRWTEQRAPNFLQLAL